MPLERKQGRQGGSAGHAAQGSTAPKGGARTKHPHSPTRIGAVAGGESGRTGRREQFGPLQGAAGEPGDSDAG